MGQYYNSGDRISELLDYLQLYREIINQGAIDSHYSKQVEALVKEIETLETMEENGENLFSYDFSTLNKKLAAVFHPDRCNIDFNKLGYPEDMYAKINGIVQDLTKLQKSGTSSAYKQNPTSSQTTKRRRRDAYYGAPSGNEEQQYTSDEEQQYASEEEEEVPDSFSVTGFFKDRFLAIFASIPSCQEDFDRIKERLDSSISNLKFRLDVIEQRIRILESKKSTNNIERYNLTRDDAINYEYEEHLNALYEKLLRADDRRKKAETKRAIRYQELRPQINNKFSLFVQDGKKYYRKYTELLEYYNSNMANMIAFDEKATHEKITEMRQTFLDTYYDEKRVFQKIEESVLDEDSAYLELEEAAKNAASRFQEIERNFREYKANEKKHKSEIKDEVEKDYQKEDSRLDREIKKSYMRKGKIKRRLDESEQKYTEFMDKYENIYRQDEPGRRFK